MLIALYNDCNWLKSAIFGKIKEDKNSNMVLPYIYIDPSNNPLINIYHSNMSKGGLSFNEENNYKMFDIAYDKNGNLLTLKRNGYGSSNLELDQLQYQYNHNGTQLLNNRLVSVADSKGTHNAGDIGNNSYTYNAIGQVIAMSESSKNKTFTYDVYGHLTSMILAAAGYEGSYPTKYYFGYDDKGFRTYKKTIYSFGSLGQYTQETWYVRDPAGNILSTYEKSSATNNTIKQTELPIYGASRLGVIDRGIGTSNTDVYKYELTDHLGNVRVVLRAGATLADPTSILNYADYYPFGWEMPGRCQTGDAYKFGYQGQFAEKDPETGWNHFEAREFDSRLGKWMIPDPAGQYWSPYMGMGNDPINGVDPDGRDYYRNWATGALIWEPNNHSFFSYYFDQQYQNVGDYTMNWDSDQKTMFYYSKGETIDFEQAFLSSDFVYNRNSISKATINSLRNTPIQLRGNNPIFDQNGGVSGSGGNGSFPWSTKYSAKYTEPEWDFNIDPFEINFQYVKPVSKWQYDEPYGSLKSKHNDSVWHAYGDGTYGTGFFWVLDIYDTVGYNSFEPALGKNGQQIKQPRK